MKKIKIKTNKNSRLFFVGDIHGHFDIFNFALKSIGIKKDDTIVSVGDLIDRGDKNIECLSYFLHAKNAYAVRGNHEDMAIKGNVYNMRRDHLLWMQNGGDWALNYNDEFIKGIFEQVNKTFPYLIEVNHEGKKFGVCHAEFPKNNWKSSIQPSDYKDLIWRRNESRKEKSDRIVKNVDYLIHGHSIFKEPKILGNQQWIDTGVYRDAGMFDGYGLTIAEYYNGKFIYHKFFKDHLSPSGFIHS